MSDTLKEEGLTLFRRGLQDEALAKFEAAAASYAAEGNDTGRGEMLNNIGVIQRVKRNYPAAIAALTQAQELFARIGDTNRQAQALGNLGDLYATQGEHVQAQRCYSDSAEQFAQVGDREKQSQVLRALSLYYLRQRQFALSMRVMDQSLTALPQRNIFQRIFHSMVRFALRLFGGT